MRWFNNQKQYKSMKPFKLFAALKKLREFEKLQLPFIKSIIDFDIIIEIGYAQEQKKAFTPKQLFLTKLGSLTTVRRRLAKLTEQGIVTRRINTSDHRSDFLTISPASLKLLEKYGSVLSSISAPT
jgi:DNA-binding MarR family transcriptional regulator